MGKIRLSLTILGVLLVLGWVTSSFASTPSGNGNQTNGQHTGEPCAGCVGNADNQTPPGQSPGDKNNGFKCDNNNGIGQTNPSHTGCTTTTTERATTTTQQNTTTTEKIEGTTTTLGSNRTTTTVLGAVPLATTTTVGSNTPPQNGSPAASPSTVPAMVLGNESTRSNGQLPFTGSNTLPIAIFGFALVTTGLGLTKLAHAK